MGRKDCRFVRFKAKSQRISIFQEDFYFTGGASLLFFTLSKLIQMSNLKPGLYKNIFSHKLSQWKHKKKYVCFCLLKFHWSPMWSRQERKDKNFQKIIAISFKVFSDQTPEQQIYMKHLKEELKQKSNDGDKDLTIRHVKECPKLLPNYCQKTRRASKS